MPVNLLFDSGYHRDSRWCFQKHWNQSLLASVYSLLPCGFCCSDNSLKLALVFKCASDTIFLDDFKSVLESITTKAIGRAGGHVHRGPSGQSSHSGVGIPTHKADGNDFGTEVTIHSEHPLRNTRRKWMPKLFARPEKDNKNGSKQMHIQRDTTITLSNLSPFRNRKGSFGSSDRILPKPEATASRHPPALGP